MSKKSKKKARKRRQRRKPPWTFICTDCGKAQEASAAALLISVQDSLNAAVDAGMKVRLRHFVEMAGPLGGGFILPWGDGHFRARTPTYDPVVLADAQHDEDEP